MTIDKELITLINHHLGVAPVNIHENSSFEEDLGADSLDMIELMMSVEEEYGLPDGSIPDEKVRNLRTVAEAQDLINALKAA